MRPIEKCKRGRGWWPRLCVIAVDRMLSISREPSLMERHRQVRNLGWRSGIRQQTGWHRSPPRLLHRRQS